MQTVLVVISIVSAVFYLTWRFIAQANRKKKAGCEKCGLSNTASNGTRL